MTGVSFNEAEFAWESNNENWYLLIQKQNTVKLNTVELWTKIVSLNCYPKLI